VIEIALTLGLIGAAVGVTALFALVPWHILFGLGLSLVGLGMLIGVPTGFWFHVLLYRVMRERKIVDRRWWLRPVRVYEMLAVADRRRVSPWLYAGGAGFVIALVGCALFAVGAFRS